MAAEVAHLVWPLRMDGASLADVEQDTVEDVRQCVHMLLSTPPGARPLAPDVGTDDPTFEGVDPEQLAAELEELEDRASVAITVTPTDATGEQVVEIQVALADEPEDEGGEL